MLDVIGITLNILAPIFLIIFVSGVFGRIFNPDPRPLSAAIIYLFVPALVLRTLALSTVAVADVLAIGGAMLLFTLIMIGVGYGAVRLFRIDRRLTGAFLVSLVMVNAANYGIPLNTFAFGPAGGEIATIYYVLAVIIGNNTGIFLASNGKVGMQGAVLNVIKVPVFSATIIGVLLAVFDLAIPLPIDRALDIMGSGAIPAMLVILGVQLARVRLDEDWRAVGIATGLRLVAAPLIITPIALLLGLDGLPLNVTIVQTATPTAVLAAAVVLEFGDNAPFVSAVTFVSTFASMITITILLALLGV
jgi:malate permease and related proteins